MEARRKGDTIEIPGNYQHNALKNGFIVQRFWHNLKLTTLERLGLPTRSETVLDLGCGSGVISDFLGQSAGTVHAVDNNPKAIEFAREMCKHQNVHFHLNLADELDFEDKMFDRIYLFEFVEHLYWNQVIDLFGKLQRLLKPQGCIILTTPNYHGMWPVVEWLMDALKLAPHMAEHQHVSRPTAKLLADLAATSGYQAVQINRAFGIAPFLSIFGWKFAEVIDRAEIKIGCPLGNLLVAVFRKP